MPSISVLMNTARSGYSMTGFRDIHHFNLTIDSLRRQTFKDFELIISDYIYDKRPNEFSFSSISNTDFPIFHVPIVHSKFKDLGYVAISACKNNGIFYAEGQYLVFIDDCSEFENKYLQKIFNIITRNNTFPNPLHTKRIGVDNQLDSSGNPVKDCRFIFFDQQKKDVIVDNFHLYGYMTCSLAAAIRLNGFDEMYDGSRQLEDIDFGERLKAAGFSISLHKNLIAVEQQHSKIAPDHNDHHPWHAGIKLIEPDFKENMKCNGPWLKMKLERRLGDDLIVANMKKPTPEEVRDLIDCYKLDRANPAVLRCGVSGGGCNWSLNGKLDKHMTSPDARIYLDNPSIFNMNCMRGTCLSIKQKYRVK